METAFEKAYIEVVVLASFILGIVKNTKKTSDSDKVNLISSVLKPGYRILIRDDKFNYIKNAEVEIFELEKK